ncbi:MAG: HEPN domain-containing protein [Desulfobacula sp.]|jgi:HEPN domain-containing protein
MDRIEFIDRMPSIDRKLADKGVPIHARTFHAFPLLAPTYEGPLLGYGIDKNFHGDYEGPNLLEKINTWYAQQYGDRFNAPTDRGKVPVLLRQEIYLIRVPLVYGSPEIQILPLVNGLTPAMAKSLSNDDLDEIQKRFVEGYGLTYEFEDLLSQIDAEIKKGTPRRDNPFLSSALRDKDTASDCLEGAIDTNGAVFHSQQLAEKMLKAVIFNSTGMSEEDVRKKYNHRIPDIFKDVSSNNAEAAQVSSAIGEIAIYKMDIRYTSNHIPKNEAIDAFWAGLRVGGWCATLISGHNRRV